MARLDEEVVDILRLSAVPAAPPHARSGVGGGRRWGESDEEAGKKSACGIRERRASQRLRSRAGLPLPPRPADGTDRVAALDYLSITLSHPRWLAERWLDRVGIERAEAWMTFNNQPAPADAAREPAADRARRAAGSTSRRDDIEAHARPIRAGRARRSIAGNLRGGARARLSSSCRTRRRSWSRCWPARRRDRCVLDTCASPGGKATAIAARCSVVARGSIACDIRERRMALLRGRCRHRRAEHVRLVQADVTTPLPFPAAVLDRRLWTRPARGSARSAAIPTSGGAATQSRLCRPSPPRSAACSTTRAAVVARRPSGLRHLLERARRERAGGRRVSRRPIRHSRRSRADAAHPAIAGRSGRCARAPANRTGPARARAVLRRGLRASSGQLSSAS